MSPDELKIEWRREEQKPFVGWDFSYLNIRFSEGKPPWSYHAIAADLLHSASAVLDLDTGGGERLLALREHWPTKVIATEGYMPNFKLATERLQPLGVNVVSTTLGEDDNFPFVEGEFDLVLNRHGALNASEIARVLVTRGVFLTEQVHASWAWDLLAVFDTEPAFPEATSEQHVCKLTAAGIEVVRVDDWKGKLCFNDVGAVVYYLRAIPWMVPGFSVDTHFDHLLELQRLLEAKGELVFEARKYFIEGKKSH